MSEAAVLLCGHGSRDCEAIAEFELVAAALHPSLPEFDVGIGYLEFARPTIRDGLDALAERGARQIFAIPGMLLAASHVKRDLPREINTFMALHKGFGKVGGGVEGEMRDARIGEDLRPRPSTELGTPWLSIA